MAPLGHYTGVLKIGVLKNFATFTITGKHLCWSLFLIKILNKDFKTCFKMNMKTLCVVTIAMFCSDLTSE